MVGPVRQYSFRGPPIGTKSTIEPVFDRRRNGSMLWSTAAHGMRANSLLSAGFCSEGWIYEIQESLTTGNLRGISARLSLAPTISPLPAIQMSQPQPATI